EGDGLRGRVRPGYRHHGDHRVRAFARATACVARCPWGATETATRVARGPAGLTRPPSSRASPVATAVPWPVHSHTSRQTLRPGGKCSPRSTLGRDVRRPSV